MKRLVGAVLICVAGATAVMAEENFSKAVRPEDFSAAGLGKLSSEELGRLDALVRDFKTGALEAVRREVAAGDAPAAAGIKATPAEAGSRPVREAAQARPAAEATKEMKSEGGLLGKAKVLLAPGTQVEYATVTSRIAGDFTGWEGRTMFKLENGQRWQAAGGDSYVTPPIANPKVTIAPGMLGAFWMTIEGVRSRVKVVPVGGGK